MRKEKKQIQNYKATHKEICNQALEEYEEMTYELVQWNSVIPKAIEFYKKFGETNLKNLNNYEERKNN